MENFKFDEKIYSCKFSDGTFIWPVFRYRIINALMHDGCTQTSKVKKNSSLTTIVNMIKGLTSIRFKKKDIVYISDDGDNVINGNTYKNKIHHDQFHMFHDNSMLYESSPMNFNYKSPKIIKGVSNIFDYLRVLIHFLSFFKVNKHENKDVEMFVKYVCELGYTDAVTLRHDLYNFDHKVNIIRFVYRLFLKFTNPKIIIVNSASYGSNLGLLIHEAKKLKIKTAEMQHGHISESHPAYSFYPSELRSCFKSYFPDDLLTFGQLWSDAVSFINNTEVIGYDYLNNKCLKYKDVITNCDFDILFISQWTITAELVQICLDVKNKYPDKTIAFRLHPVEELTLAQKNQLEQASIKIVRSIDVELYEHLAQAKVIIGGYSTVLYESVALNKVVFQYETNFTKNDLVLDVLNVFTSIDELDIESSINKEIIDKLWYQDSHDAFYQYIYKHIGNF